MPGYSGTVNGVQYETTQNDHTCCIASTDFPNTITLNVTAPVAGDDANIVSFGELDPGWRSAARCKVMGVSR